MKTNPDEPLNVFHGCWNDEMNKTHAGRGLTKREYFAAMAMQGLCAHESIGNESEYFLAELAVDQADSLIEALNKRQDK